MKNETLEKEALSSGLLARYAKKKSKALLKAQKKEYGADIENGLKASGVKKGGRGQVVKDTVANKFTPAHTAKVHKKLLSQTTGKVEAHKKAMGAIADKKKVEEYKKGFVAKATDKFFGGKSADKFKRGYEGKTNMSDKDIINNVKMTKGETAANVAGSAARGAVNVGKAMGGAASYTASKASNLFGKVKNKFKSAPEPVAKPGFIEKNKSALKIAGGTAAGAGLVGAGLYAADKSGKNDYTK